MKPQGTSPLISSLIPGTAHPAGDQPRTTRNRAETNRDKSESGIVKFGTREDEDIKSIERSNFCGSPIGVSSAETSSIAPVWRQVMGSALFGENVVNVASHAGFLTGRSLR